MRSEVPLCPLYRGQLWVEVHYVFYTGVLYSEVNYKEGSIVGILYSEVNHVLYTESVLHTL